MKYCNARPSFLRSGQRLFLVLKKYYWTRRNIIGQRGIGRYDIVEMVLIQIVHCRSRGSGLKRRIEEGNNGKRILFS